MSKRELMKVYTVRQGSTCGRTNYVVTYSIKSACNHIIESTVKQYKDIPFLALFDVTDKLLFSSEYTVKEYITALERLRHEDHMMFDWSLGTLILQKACFNKTDRSVKTCEVNSWNFNIPWILVGNMYNIQSKCFKYNCKGV